MHELRKIYVNLIYLVSNIERFDNVKDMKRSINGEWISYFKSVYFFEPNCSR